MSVYSSVTSRLRGWEAPPGDQGRCREKGEARFTQPGDETPLKGHQNHLDCVDSSNVCPAPTIGRVQPQHWGGSRGTTRKDPLDLHKVHRVRVGWGDELGSDSPWFHIDWMLFTGNRFWAHLLPNVRESPRASWWNEG